MNNDFMIVKEMKLFIKSLDNIVINYPRKELIIKNRLLNDSLDIQMLGMHHMQIHISILRILI